MTDEANTVDSELEEVVAMSPEQVTLYLARAGISPEDMDAMWRRSCEKWAADPNPDVADFGRSMMTRSMRGGGK